MITIAMIMKAMLRNDIQKAASPISFVQFARPTNSGVVNPPRQDMKLSETL